jgi:geranylgeranyl diphosphate synthase, type I
MFMQQVLQDFIATYKPQIDEGIAQELSKREEEVLEISPHLRPIVAAMRELSVGGKRLRGILTLLGYELSGKQIDAQAVRAAVAMEIFHLGLLIQDDVMDQDGLRRGVQTIHARYPDKHLGESVAVLAGDYTFGWVTELLSELGDTEVLKVWGKYFARVGYGQTLDVLAEIREATEEEILQVLSLNSGEYSCVLPLVLGAILGKAETPLLKRLAAYGMELGLVFQIRDDYLGMYGDTQKTGKSVASPSEQTKKTLVSMYTKDQVEEKMSEHLEQGARYTGGDGRLAALLQYVATRQD